MCNKIFILLTFFVVPVAAGVNFKKIFHDRDGCFLLSDLESGKIISVYNSARCKEQYTPCSTFKIAAALMAFENGIIKNEDQVIKWDGVKRERSELNIDQTPLTWMSNSSKWVTEWIMMQLGLKTIQKYLNDFDYGNKDFTGGLKDAWQATSLKISAYEQVNFISKLWKGQLSVSKNTIELTKKLIFLRKIGNSELYGKTGTGCLDGNACISRSDKMIGTFVGILKTQSKTYIFASNATDLKSQKYPAGPRLKNTTIEILTKLGLVAD